jgi:uncharacterized protein RhaS with RHS repeats
MTDSIGTTTYSYDALNRLTQLFNWATWKDVIYTYNNVGNLTNLDYPGWGFSMDYTYDVGNRMATASSWGNTVSYAYDDAGRLITSTYPASSGLTTSRTYDDAGRLTSLTNKKGATTISSFTYTLNEVGIRTQMQEASGGINTYSYDNLYRLTGVTYPEALTYTYTYDDVVIRLTKGSAGGSSIR